MVKRTVVAVFVVFAVAAAALSQVGKVQESVGTPGDKPMHGLIRKMTAVDGKRDALIDIMIEGVRDMPGCLSYVVAKDAADSNAVWITEVWDSKSSHRASLSIPSVRQAMTQGKPLISDIGQGFITTPVGGRGLGLARN